MTRLVQEKPKEMLCGNMIWLLSQDLAVERLGICQPARLMQSQRLLDLLVQSSANRWLPACSALGAFGTLLSSQSPVYDRSAAFDEPLAGLSQ
jgi:hypothetical protein